MLRLRSRIVSHILSSPSAFRVSPPHRLLSAAAAPISPTQRFAVEEYLVDTCGLTRAQAVKASTKLSHLKSPANPDAVLAFLAGLGLPRSAVAAAVAKDPRLLCAGVDRTLASNVVGLTTLGLSSSDVALFVSIAGEPFRFKSIVPKLQYYLPLFGSSGNFFRALKKSSHLLTANRDRVVEPNAAFLRECGLGACDIAKLCMVVPRILTAKPELLRRMVARAEALGVPRGSGMFRHALQAVSFKSEDKIAAKASFLKKIFRWSDAEVSHAVCKAPIALRKSNSSLQERSEFFLSEVGLEPAYIAHRPALLSYSMEGRLRPRYYVIKFLKAKGLLDQYRDYYNIVMLSDKVFMERFICPHKKAAPCLAKDYATACKGEVPTNFRFT
ncbi:transcription termination factor MTERF8, chloroplastic-like [Hordeum vulgare subsp. vulgare]|uniref:Predicted protein n=1 Tax=Hordeum vulgare subsp. vulgare TaxID=112509 RepID=F2CX35_HORVV|nr:transcription termination factor MTERF8, chloroplastic-like [Hordeum vulgare subsp. vulgare]KAI4967094.1 hypothetical protein ZWY2020_031051 [Hordeum vulgare]KAI4978805.1 hypothetical protein ZWY2020_015558 [Hordeum vulgare]BAJ87406.1 predicted protein [Hordeum vulgare subsp. vulgare]